VVAPGKPAGWTARQPILYTALITHGRDINQTYLMATTFKQLPDTEKHRFVVEAGTLGAGYAPQPPRWFRYRGVEGPPVRSGRPLIRAPQLERDILGLRQRHPRPRGRQRSEERLYLHRPEQHSLNRCRDPHGVQLHHTGRRSVPWATASPSTSKRLARQRGCGTPGRSWPSPRRSRRLPRGQPWRSRHAVA